MTFPRLVLYHLCEKSLYEEALKSQKAYFPPTFDQEKFTHTTSDPELLLPIANEFYQGIKGDFILLWIDQEKIKYEVKYEAPLPLPGFEENNVLENHLRSKVIQSQSENLTQNISQPGKVCLEQYEANPDALKCPHVYGPIELETIFKTTNVIRNPDGSFERFEGLTSC